MSDLQPSPVPNTPEGNVDWEKIVGGSPPALPVATPESEPLTEGVPISAVPSPALPQSFGPLAVPYPVPTAAPSQPTVVGGLTSGYPAQAGAAIVQQGPSVIGGAQPAVPPPLYVPQQQAQYQTPLPGIPPQLTQQLPLAQPPLAQPPLAQAIPAQAVPPPEGATSMMLPAGFPIGGEQGMVAPAVYAQVPVQGMVQGSPAVPAAQPAGLTPQQQQFLAGLTPPPPAYAQPSLPGYSGNGALAQAPAQVPAQAPAQVPAQAPAQAPAQLPQKPTRPQKPADYKAEDALLNPDSISGSYLGQLSKYVEDSATYGEARDKQRDTIWEQQQQLRQQQIQTDNVRQGVDMTRRLLVDAGAPVGPANQPGTVDHFLGWARSSPITPAAMWKVYQAEMGLGDQALTQARLQQQLAAQGQPALYPAPASIGQSAIGLQTSQDGETQFFDGMLAQQYADNVPY